MEKTPHFHRAVGVVIVLGIISCLLTAVFLGKSLAQHRSNNTVLLGILSAPAQGGVEAPAWIAYAWANVADDEQPPTRENTTGKVVVIHAFQSW